MKKRSRTGGEQIKGRRPKTPEPKRRNAPEAVGRSKSAPAQKDTEVARLIRELSEARERQTATSDVLQVISSSAGELEPVFQTILANATRLCEANLGTLLLYEGGPFRVASLSGAPSAWAAFRRRDPIVRPGRKDDPLCRVAATKQLQHIADIRTEKAYIEHDPPIVAMAQMSGARTLLLVPMLKENELVGVIGIYRQEIRPFTDKQIDLVKNFAAQAVIAIENARLLTELRQSLEQQTATADVLKVISSSLGSLEPVFIALLTNATRLCGASYGNLWLCEGDAFRSVALVGELPPSYVERWGTGAVFRPGSDVPLAKATRTKQPYQISDIRASKPYREGNPLALSGVDEAGILAVLAVPLLKDGDVVGAILIYSKEARPFTEKQVELLENFAAQAVIAIENARLLNEQREALEHQTATANVLHVINSSPGDLKPVFEAMLESATRICEASFGSMLLREGERLHRVAVHNAPPSFVEFHNRHQIVDYTISKVITRIWTTKQLVHITDLLVEDPNDTLAKVADARTLLVVPLLKDDELVGIFGIYRQEVRPFTDKQIALVTNFASQAVIAIENARLLSELRQRTAELTERTTDLTEALEQQTATSEVLRVVSSSPSDLQPVFAAMLENAVRICAATFGNIFRWDGEAFHLVTAHKTPPAFAKARKLSPLHPVATSHFGRLLETKSVVHTPDLSAEQQYAEERRPAYVEAVELGGIKTVLAVPMLKDDELIGAFGLFRQEVRPFTDKQIELVKNFAAQAVIAIENARLLNELRQRTADLTEALEQQTATSEVLRVISSSPGDLGPVFAAMLENAVRICDSKFGNIYRWDGEAFHLLAAHNGPPAIVEHRRRTPNRPHPNAPMGRMVATKRLVHVVDAAAEGAYVEQREPGITAAVELGGVRTALYVPMLKESELIGVFTIFRQEVRPFTAKQIEIVQNFAAQAVIATENTRLLNELRQSLEQQTATAEVLKVISSSPGKLEPVFTTMLEKAVHICDAKFGGLYLYQDGRLRTVAAHDEPEFFAARRGVAWDPPPGGVLDEAIRSKRATQVADMAKTKPYIERRPRTVEAVELGGIRTGLAVPMLKDDEVVGIIAIHRREVLPFTDKQIELISNFAAQAVIAIENARLLNELRQRTDDLSQRTTDLTEALEQQTATSEVLQVISASPGDLEPVFISMLQNAVRICDAKFGSIYRWTDGALHIVATYNSPDVYAEARRRLGIIIQPGDPMDRLLTTKNFVHVADFAAEPSYVNGRNPQIALAVEQAGVRTGLLVPMLRENDLIGVFALLRQEVRPFADKQILLVTNFAAQAVIAIENARLLNELRESLQQQTATADVLKVISRSAFDLQAVLDTLVVSAARLCEADGGNIAREREGVYQRVAIYGFSDEFTEYVKTIPVIPERGTATGRALLDGKVVHIPDVQADPEYTFAEAQKLGGYRTILSLPMLREGVPIGVLALTRREVRPFTDKQIELVSTFADQAAIAIENVRLFESVEARTRELAMSLDDLRNAQDRLVQTEKLASLGQLTAGIAHEIKNPLNFVNNFSAVSVELIDELREALGGVNLDSKLRAEISEIADTLQGNLDKVVQHGKRADAIVKNMLLHSRQGSGEHRPVDINALVDESLNLAYHGARAEKQGFNITLERSFDPAAGEVDLFPQEITRALLNLISNGFYAATKRKAEANGGNYEPTLAAATKNLGNSVEIRIRDNGTGITPEVREKLFSPFFTTKPAGEGTGLGLSISHDIIVKQHGGSIEVDTQPGEFTEFRIVLPRAGTALIKSGERT